MKMIVSLLLLTFVGPAVLAQTQLKKSSVKPAAVKPSSVASVTTDVSPAKVKPAVVSTVPAASALPNATAAPPTTTSTGQPLVFTPRPNINDKNSKSSGQDIISNFLNLLGAPKESDPEFDDYMRNSEDYPADYSDGFRPSDGVEVKQDYGGLCRNYPITNINKQFAGHNCSDADKDRMTCMVCNIYYESLNEPYEGKVAVGQTVMARLFSSQYAGPNDGACEVVYRKSRTKSGKSVAQYSWTIENKSHTMQAGPMLSETIKAAQDALCKGPGKYTNYFATSIVNPPWNKTGQCAEGPREKIGGHQFCAINAKATRTISQVMQAEGEKMAGGGDSSTTAQ